MKARKAPIAEAKATKRAAPIQQHIEGLNEEMTSLEASTRIRNEELHRHLDAIRQRGANWEAKLKLEVQARDEASKMLRQHFDTILEEATTEEEDNLMKMVERFHGELIPAQETRQARPAIVSPQRSDEGAVLGVKWQMSLLKRWFDSARKENLVHGCANMYICL